MWCIVVSVPVPISGTKDQGSNLGDNSWYYLYNSCKGSVTSAEFENLLSIGEAFNIYSKLSGP